MAEDGGGKKHPIIIKRKKGGGGEGHHGGAWKVAYADFVTAMMAFFLLMWLLNATSEEQKKGLADYFDDRIPLVRQSGGGDGAFKGDSMVTNKDLARSGGGVAADEAGRASGRGANDSDRSGPSEETPPEKVAEAKAFAALEKAFDSLSGESDVTDRMLSHVRTRTTDDGLVIDVFDTEESPLFEPGTDRPTPTLEALVSVVASVAALVKNPVAVTGHTDATTVGGTGDADDWKLSSDRALVTRGLLVGAGLDAARIAEVSGRAATKPLSDDPLDPRNRRVEITLLRTFGNR